MSKPYRITSSRQMIDRTEQVVKYLREAHILLYLDHGRTRESDACTKMAARLMRMVQRRKKDERECGTPSLR